VTSTKETGMTKLILTLVLGSFVAAFALEVADQGTRRVRAGLGRTVRDLRHEFLRGYARGAR